MHLDKRWQTRKRLGTHVCMNVVVLCSIVMVCGTNPQSLHIPLKCSFYNTTHH